MSTQPTHEKKWSGLAAEVNFIFDDTLAEELFPKARELDAENVLEGEEAPDYTLAQAFQIVWHMDPAWLHKRLFGWTMDKAAEGDDPMRDVWPGPA